jgi:uncharacterized membrane protein
MSGEQEDVVASKTDRTTKLRRRLGRYRLVAIISLAVNLFVIGIFVGGIMRDKRRGFGPPGGGPPFSLRGAKGLISSGARPVADEVQRAHEERVDRAFDALRAKAEQVDAALGAEPFDKQRLETALDDMRSAHQALQIELHQEFVELATKLEHADREKLVKATRRPGRPRGGER